MDMFAGITLIYAIPAFVVGALVGLTGVGGGSLMTPLLVLMFGIHPATAVGTDLLQASVTKSVGTMMHGAGGTVEWKVVRRLATGSLPASALVIYVLSNFGVNGELANHIISIVLGFALLLTALSVFFRHHIVLFLNSRFGVPSDATARRYTIIFGAILGVLVSLTSVGAGAVGVTVLLLLYPHLPLSRIVGTDIAHAVPLTLLAGLGHWWLGSVDMSLLLSLLIGSIPGIIVGSYMAVRVPDPVLRPILASTLAMVGIKLVS